MEVRNFLIFARYSILPLVLHWFPGFTQNFLSEFIKTWVLCLALADLHCVLVTLLHWNPVLVRSLRFYRRMWTPPLWSMSLLDVKWIGPKHLTDDLRSMKRHLEKEGVLYCKRSRGTSFDVASLKGLDEIMQFRTTGDGVVIQTVVLTRPGEQNDLEREILAHDGRVFLTRLADHATLPTVQYYHLVAKPISVAASDLDEPASTLPAIYTKWRWDYVAPKAQSAFYYLIQGAY